MDRYLLDKFVFEMDDELYDNCRMAFAKMAKNVIRNPNEKKVTFNYYPHEQELLQLVVEGFIENNSAQIGDVKIHHASEDVWKLKIVAAIDGCDGSYLATRQDGNGFIAVRFVNEQVLDTTESDSIVEAQVVAFAVDISIYRNEAVYANSVTPSANGQKLLMKEGLIVSTNYMVNNSGNLTEEERKNKEHCFDNLVDICGVITKCDKIPLNMFGMELNHYYWANIMTDFGQVKIIIARPLFPKNSQSLCAGNIIVGKVMLSGDVCISITINMLPY